MSDHRPAKSKTSRTRRRWILGILLSVLLLGAAWWFLWVPNWRPHLSAGESYGIDVSAHQGDINWGSVAKDEIDFAYIKATEGEDFIDERFEENWNAANEAGLDRGAYHFFTLCTSGADQAQNFLRVAAPQSGALPPAVDLELAGNCSDRPSRQEMQRELDQFLRLVEEAWQTELLLYLGNDFESFYEVDEALDRSLWLRRFLVRPSSPEWVIWQLHGYARVDGVHAGVDLDVMRPSPIERSDGGSGKATTQRGNGDHRTRDMSSDRHLRAKDLGWIVRL